MKPIVLLGEAMGENEAKLGVPFVGASGVELLRMLHDAGALELTAIDLDYLNQFWRTGKPTFVDMVWRLHPEFHRTNVFQLHPPGNRLEWFCGPKVEGIKGYPKLASKGPGYVRREFIPQLERLGDELSDLDPNLVICLGNTALWALCGTTGISKLRGTTCLSSHTISGVKCLATYHPAAVLRQWELRPVTVIDLMKASREAEYPEVRRPKREIWIEPTLEDIHDFAAKYIRPARLTSVDIETSGNQVTCIGLGIAKASIVIPFTIPGSAKRSYWPNEAAERGAWQAIRGLLEDPTILKLFQNGLYDIAFLFRAYGIKVMGASEDTMLCHHALQPESLKGLGFLGSVYCDEGAWKSMRKVNDTIKRDA